MELEFHVKFLTFLDFHQIEFQNRSILLDNFRTEAFCYIFWTKGANAHFGQLFENRKRKWSNNNMNIHGK